MRINLYRSPDMPTTEVTILMGAGVTKDELAVALLRADMTEPAPVRKRKSPRAPRGGTLYYAFRRVISEELRQKILAELNARREELSPQAQKVLELSYRDEHPLTPAQMVSELKLSRPRIGDLKSKSLRKLGFTRRNVKATT